MKVIYKPYLLKHVYKLLVKAEHEDKEIEKIILTKAEVDQLKAESWHEPNWRGKNPGTLYGNDNFTMYGIPVEVEK